MKKIFIVVTVVTVSDGDDLIADVVLTTFDENVAKDTVKWLKEHDGETEGMIGDFSLQNACMDWDDANYFTREVQEEFMVV